MTLYRSSRNRREWLHVDDHCRAIDLILERGTVGETYNVGSGVEVDVEGIANRILKLLRADESLKTYVPDRPATTVVTCSTRRSCEKSLAGCPRLTSSRASNKPCGGTGTIATGGNPCSNASKSMRPPGRMRRASRPKYRCNAGNSGPVRMPAQSMDDLVALCKRRGFVFQASEIYGESKACTTTGPWAWS